MPQKKYTSLGDKLKSARRDVTFSAAASTLPDIITFCEGEYYLNLKNQGWELYPMQKIMLKAFYRGTIGNENLKLTEEELQLCKEVGLDGDDHGNVLEKYSTGELFGELVLVWGRRCFSEDTYLPDPKTGLMNKVGKLWDDGVRTISTYTYDEKNKKMVVMDNCPILYQGEREVYRVVLFSGHEIEITDNHPLLIKDRGWVELSKIDVTRDKIATVASMPFFGDSGTITGGEASSVIDQKSSLRFEKIKSVELVGKKRTFDVSVSDKKTLQNLVTNGVISHNSGKDYVSSIIAVYEACRVLEIPGGDPYKYYGVSNSNPITILTIATAADQAEICFSEMRSKILQSKYFEDKYVPDGICADRIYLQTQQDKEDNKAFAARKLPQKKGSVVVQSGHSNSLSLLGKGIIVVIFDEVASYQLSGGPSSGERLYSGILPSLITFGRLIELKDENGDVILDNKGKPKKKKIFDSKVISISSPRGKEGVLYDRFVEAPKIKGRLVCRLPTWIVNPNQPEEALREKFPMSEEDFAMEFGAEFCGLSGSNFFTKDMVDAAFSSASSLQDFGQPGVAYFLHIDPSTTSNNYALVILHREFFVNPQTKKVDFHIIVDHIKYWHPKPNQPINVDMVDEYLLSLKNRFYLSIVTYDAMNDIRSVEKLKKNGIPHKMTRYNHRYKMLIYTNLYNLLCEKRVVIPDHEMLKKEMYNLQKKVIEKGFKVLPKSGADVKTDDIVDCLAGACFMALSADTNNLPTGRLVNMTSSHASGQFKSMQGTPYTVNPNTRLPFYNPGQSILPEKR